jgi:hypothetical protein
MEKSTAPLTNLLSFVFCLVLFFNCNPKHCTHLGEWKTNDKGKNWSLILSKDGTALLVLNNQVYGGQDFEMEGKKYTLSYEIDYSKTPVWLDFFVKDESTGAVEKLTAITRFITDTKMEVRFNFDSPDNRLNGFDPKDTQNTGVFEKAVN